MSVEVAFESAPPTPPAGALRWTEWLPVGVASALALVLAGQWLCAGTVRLYLDDRVPSASAPPSAAQQRFEIRSGRVEPRILAPDGERLRFPARVSGEADLRVVAAPAVRAMIEIAVVEGGARRVVHRRALTSAAEIVVRIPTAAAALELGNAGEVEWRDPRVVDEPDFRPGFLGLLAVATWSLVRPRGLRFRPLPGRTRSVFVRAATAAIALGLSATVLEAGLRALGDWLPPWIAADRRNLGEVRPDPRWRDTARYGPRLAPDLRTLCEWRHGDIVRMGFIAPDVLPHPVYRFPFVTDAEGFRNTDPPTTPAAVAALGDSFTDAMTLPGERAWPARLATLLGASVRNYGTAGFGPEQERRVLEEYVQPRRPRRVVVGFFAGNDLQDAEKFERLLGEGAVATPASGWKFKHEVARYDELYLVSLYHGAAGFLHPGDQDVAAPSASPAPEDYSGEDPRAPSVSRPAFDRGVFSVPVAGRALRFAFLPPYLNAAKRPRSELIASRGWDLTRRAYADMARRVRSWGGELVVMFIPSKTQVYWPLLEAAFPRAELEAAVRACFRGQPYAATPDEVSRNRDVLAGLVRDLCREEGLTFLDLTSELRSRAGAGHNVYFPDDSHWNAEGHEVAARALARLAAAERW
jgi:hypothetical protein